MATYLISDLHFDDEWIAKSLRSFHSLYSMNNALLDRCESIIGSEDKFIFLGDLIGSNGNKKQLWDWYGELPKIDIWVVGNHDKFNKSGFSDHYLPLKSNWEFEHNGYEFFCTHKPGNIPDTWEDWSIYGHVHNEKPAKYPFIDPVKKRINVSAAMINYAPISADEIVELIETGQKYTYMP